MYTVEGKDAGSYLPGTKIPEGCYAAYYEILWADPKVYSGKGFTGCYGSGASYTVTPFGRDGQYSISVRSRNGFDFDDAIEYCQRKIGFEVDTSKSTRLTLPALRSAFERLTYLFYWVATGKEA